MVPRKAGSILEQGLGRYLHNTCLTVDSKPATNCPYIVHQSCLDLVTIHQSMGLPWEWAKLGAFS